MAQNVIRGLNFTNANVGGAVFAATGLVSTQWEDSNFSSVKFTSSSQIIGGDFLDCNFDWSRLDMDSMYETTFTGTSLVGARFSGVECQSCEFSNSNLQQVTFERVHGTWLFTGNTQLSSTQFLRDGVCGSKLEATSFRGLNLARADLTGICNLDQIDLTDANVEGTQVCSQNEELLVDTQGTPVLVACEQIPDCPDQWSIVCPTD